MLSLFVGIPSAYASALQALQISVPHQSKNVFCDCFSGNITLHNGHLARGGKWKELGSIGSDETLLFLFLVRFFFFFLFLPVLLPGVDGGEVSPAIRLDWYIMRARHPASTAAVTAMRDDGALVGGMLHVRLVQEI